MISETFFQMSGHFQEKETASLSILLFDVSTVWIFSDLNLSWGSFEPGRA